MPAPAAPVKKATCPSSFTTPPMHYRVLSTSDPLRSLPRSIACDLVYNHETGLFNGLCKKLYTGICKKTSGRD